MTVPGKSAKVKTAAAAAVFAFLLFSCYYPKNAPYITGVHFDRDSLVLQAGQAAAVSAALRPAEALVDGISVNWEWQVPDSGAAVFVHDSAGETVEKSAGTVLAVRPGSTVIKVKATADGEIFEAECRIEVLPD